MAERVVIVTGGGRGIGRAICQRFAADGAQVVAASRSTPDLEETKELIEAAGGRCSIHATDVCCEDDINGLIETTLGRHGRVDVMVNNAGVAPLANIEELDASLFDTIMSVNVRAVFLGCRAVWPVMKKHGGGVIISTSSCASVDPFPGFTAYGASKSWVNAWTKALAEEGRSVAIRVFAVAPGAVETRMLRDAFPEFPSDQTLQPSDVADVVFTVADPTCRHSSGQTFFVKK
ncbi:MAG: SDR family NAD(P)-dependent oxidoreductase [Proteobacteria bacterium]|nr:SDR family NAD(P)-dependent oxidoreductase [Pseudomonadota bacterium]